MLRIKKLTLLCIFLLCYVTEVQAGKIINAADFGLRQGEDATPAINRSLAACKTQHAERLVIPKGIYQCYPDKAMEEFIHVANNDNGLKRIVFPVHGFSNFEIDAEGSTFILHGGEMIAFDFERSQNIKLKNAVIDWDKPFYFQGTVLSTDTSTNSFILRPLAECTYEIVANELVFTEKPGKAIHPWRDWAPAMKNDIGWEQNIDWNIWFDPATKAPAYNGYTYVLKSWNESLNRRYHVKQLKDGNLRFFDAVQKLPTTGWILVINGRKDLNRTSPAIHLSNVTGFAIYNVNVHHAGGMGLIAEQSQNIVLKKFNVVLPENSQRIVTTTADATHFAGCRGKIAIDSCRFENMLDDAANIHGVYALADGAVDQYTLGVKRMHGQQMGFDLVHIGDSISLSNQETLRPYAKVKVKGVKEVNAEYLEVTCLQPIAKLLQPNSVINNLSCQPDLVIQNTWVRRNRARSILISTSGNVLIENNNFEACTHTSILLAGDASFWFESGPVQSVVIRNNTFKNFGLQGSSPLLQIAPQIKAEERFYYHQNIVFENNICELFSAPLVFAKSAAHIRIVGNQIKASKAYPADLTGSSVFKFENCKDITISDNRCDDQWPGGTIKGAISMLKSYKQ